MSATKSALDVLIDECLCVKCECGVGPCDEIANRDAARAELAALREDLKLARGAMAAQDERERVAGERCGVLALEHGCDWPDAVADTLDALRERVAKLESALVKADELEAVAADVGHCLGCFLHVCDIITLHGPRLAYRIAREATK